MPSSQNNREWTRTSNKEDVKHAHDELWDFNPDANFHKIFSRESDKGIQGVLDLIKEDLEKITWREDNGVCSSMMASDV